MIRIRIGNFLISYFVFRISIPHFLLALAFAGVRDRVPHMHAPGSLGPGRHPLFTSEMV